MRPQPQQRSMAQSAFKRSRAAGNRAASHPRSATIDSAPSIEVLTDELQRLLHSGGIISTADRTVELNRFIANSDLSSTAPLSSSLINSGNWAFKYRWRTCSCSRVELLHSSCLSASRRSSCLHSGSCEITSFHRCPAPLLPLLLAALALLTRIIAIVLALAPLPLVARSIRRRIVLLAVAVESAIDSASVRSTPNAVAVAVDRNRLDERNQRKIARRMRRSQTRRRILPRAICLKR
jgi:hypothetical protein